MGNIKVSVIVPVYNTEKYLKECLDSLVNQTLEDIQIVIVDDGSTDSSADIIAEYKEKYPQKITAIRQENGGQGKARNVAFGYCEGEYIGFLDSDDYAKLEMFEKMYVAAKSEDADFVACGYTNFCIENNEIIIIDEYKIGAIQYNPPKLLLFNAEAAPWIHLYKKSVIKDNCLRFPEGVIHEDTALYANSVLYINRIVHIEETLVMHRKHKDSTVGTMTLEKVEQIFPVIDSINSWYKMRDIANIFKAEQECFCVRILLCSSIERTSKIKGFYKRIKMVIDTIKYINNHYCGYKKNKYFKRGLLSVYIKTSCLLSVALVCEVKHFKYLLNKGRQYI